MNDAHQHMLCLVIHFHHRQEIPKILVGLLRAKVALSCIIVDEEMSFEGSWSMLVNARGGPSASRVCGQCRRWRSSIKILNSDTRLYLCDSFQLSRQTNVNSHEAWSISLSSRLNLCAIGFTALRDVPHHLWILLALRTKSARVGVKLDVSTMATHSHIPPRADHENSSSETFRFVNPWTPSFEQSRILFPSRADRSRNPPLSASSAYRPPVPDVIQNVRPRSNSWQSSHSHTSSTQSHSSIRRSNSSSAEHRSPQTPFPCAVS